jgi:hypothetical protein
MRLFASLLVLVGCLAGLAWGKPRTTNQEEPDLQPNHPKVSQNKPAKEVSSAADAVEVELDVAAAALEVLKTQQGKDLRKLGEDKVKGLLRTITKLVPKRTYRGYFDFSPWYSWELKKTEGQLHYLLFEADNTGPHPGYTKIRLTLLDKRGRLNSETTFHTGWRCYLREVKLAPATKANFPMIALETDSWLGPDYSKQYYAWIGGRFDLVRLEGSNGNAVRNRYYVKHFQCGPPLPKQTETEWEADLVSCDRLKLLRGLLWLGGCHWDLHAGDQPNNQHEEFDDIRLVRNVRARKKVIARLKELTKSEDPWLREAAELALNPKDGRF